MVKMSTNYRCDEECDAMWRAVLEYDGPRYGHHAWMLKLIRKLKTWLHEQDLRHLRKYGITPPRAEDGPCVKEAWRDLHR